MSLITRATQLCLHSLRLDDFTICPRNGLEHVLCHYPSKEKAFSNLKLEYSHRQKQCLAEEMI